MAAIIRTLGSHVRNYSICCLVVLMMFCSGFVAVTVNRAAAGASENGLIYYMGTAKSLQETERKDQQPQFKDTDDIETKQGSPLAFNNDNGD